MQLSSLLGHVQQLLGAILQSEKPADSLINDFFRARKYLGARDRRFIAETTYGTIRHLRRVETLLGIAAPPERYSATSDDHLLLLILMYLRGVDKSIAFSSSDVSENIQSGALKKYLPTIMESISNGEHIIADDDVTRLGITYSFSDWMVRKFIDQYGAVEAELLCASLNEQAPTTLRVNTLKTTVEECQVSLNREGVVTTRTRISPYGLALSKRVNVFSLKSFREGLFEVQDEGSQVLPLLLDPKPTAKVLDVCAGAGGKTLALSALMKNRGELFATDINAFRLEELKRRVRRAGVNNVRVQTIVDGNELRERPGNFFDIVFIDAPCSGLGTLRRNPGMKWSVNEQTVAEISEKQRYLLGASAQFVKPGGMFAYATCTFLREENERPVEAFLAQHSEFTVVDLRQRLASLQLSAARSGSYVQLLPHRDGTDGFFFALMQKQL